MIGLGVQAGDRVAIWSPTLALQVVASLATHYAGAVVVPLNTRYTAEEAADILARTQAPLLIAMGRFLGADRVADLDRAALPDLEHIVRVPIETEPGDEAGTWNDFVSGPRAPMSEVDARAAALSGDDVSDICSPLEPPAAAKACCAPTGSSLAAPAAWGGVRSAHQRRRYLWHHPFFHNFGFKAAILACLQTAPR